MNPDMFSFDVPEWKAVLQGVCPGGSYSAIRFLTLLEGEDEIEVENAFSYLEAQKIALSVQELPADFGAGELQQRLQWEDKLARSGNIPEDLDQNDPLRLYLEELASIPAAGDPVQLMDAYRCGDETALQRLVNVTISKAVESAFRMTGRGVLLLDLIQEASLGLWQGILHYENGDLLPHLQWWIDFYLAKACITQARANGVGSKMRMALEAYRDSDRSLLTTLGRNPTVEEIAIALGISAEEAEFYEDMLRTARILDQAKNPVKEDAAEQEQAVEDTAYFQSRQRILDMLSTLTQQQAAVLTMRFGLDNATPLSLQETAQRLNLTTSQVIELEASALEQLRRDEQ